MKLQKWAYHLAGWVTLLTSGCGDGPVPEDHPWDTLHFPTQLMLSADQGHLHVLNSNFDLKYKTGALTTIDLETHRFVDNAFLPLPSYVGSMAMRVNAEGDSVAYWTDREGGELLWSPVTPGNDDWFGCTDRTVEGLCGAAYRVESAQTEQGILKMERDPFAIAMVPGGAEGLDVLLTGGLLDPRISIWTLDEEGVPALAAQRTVANGISAIESHPVTHTPYATAQYAQAVFPIELALDADGKPFVETLFSIAIPSETVLGRPVYGQNIAFDPTGSFAYVVNRYPAAVIRLDVSPGVDGIPNNSILDYAEAGASPTGIVYTRNAEGQGRLYVSATSRDEVYVYDALGLNLLTTIEVGDGPGYMVIKEVEGVGQTLFVSLFEEHGVAVVDLQVEGPWYHKHIATIR